MLQGLHTRALSSHYILKHMKKMVKLLFFFIAFQKKSNRRLLNTLMKYRMKSTGKLTSGSEVLFVSAYVQMHRI